MFLNDIKVSLQFLTVLPFKEKELEPEEMERAIPYFPLAGLILGILAYIFYAFFSLFLPRAICDILVLLVLVLLTGGLHLDGLSDTLDGLGFGKDRESSLRIMKDSRLGTFGAAGLVFAVLIKFLALNHIETSLIDNALFLMPLLGRWSVLILGYQSQYAGHEDGIGKVFVERTTKEVWMKGSLIALFASLLFFGFRGIVISAILFAVIFFIKKYFEKRLGGITGDVYGAVIELGEIAVLLLIVVMQ